MARHHYNSFFALNDLLFNIMLGFAALFILAFLLINPIAKQGDVLVKAEFIIQMSWPDNRIDDIDLWVQRDDETPISYRNKYSNEMHLERDDLGTKNDMIMVDGKNKIIFANEETVTIRGIVPGNYYVGAHYYSDMEGAMVAKKETEPTKWATGPVDVEIVISKINPYSEVFRETSTLHRKGDIWNVIGFTINNEGNVTDIHSHSRNLGPSDSKSSSTSAYNRQ